MTKKTKFELRAYKFEVLETEKKNGITKVEILRGYIRTQKKNLYELMCLMWFKKKISQSFLLRNDTRFLLRIFGTHFINSLLFTPQISSRFIV